MSRKLRKIFETKSDEVTGVWRNLHNAEFCNLYSSPNMIKMLKSNMIRVARHVVHLEEMRSTHKTSAGKSKGK
jgi:hypothetical protein